MRQREREKRFHRIEISVYRFEIFASIKNIYSAYAACDSSATNSIAVRAVRFHLELRAKRVSVAVVAVPNQFGKLCKK